MNETPELLFATSVHSRDKPPGRIGGCVGTFLQLFDWNPRKRLFSTKRLPAERPRKPTKKKFKDERMPVAKLLLLADEENRGGFPSPKRLSAAAAGAGGGDRTKDHGEEHTGKRVPGVVARLMGLESMPECNYGSEGKESPQHPKMSSAVEVRPLQELLHARQEPVLLQDLLREREYLEAKKLSLKERLSVPVPGFVKKLPTDTTPQMSYVPPRDVFKKSMRGGDHLQPYSDQKYHKSLRPLKKSGRELSDAKHLILALSPRSNADGLRPILLPSKVHNKLMSSPIKSPTKMGSRSARLLEAAVKILEPSLQSSTARSRPPPVRPSAVYTSNSKDLESEVSKAEERKERLPIVEKKVAISTNAGRALKGQSMSRSWNGREETGRYGHDVKNVSSQPEGPGRKRIDHQSQSTSHSRTASPMRSSSSTQRSRGNVNRFPVPPEENVRLVEEVKTVVPQGFEEAYEGGLKPLNVGRRDQIRLDKYEMDDRRISEKHMVSSLSVGNSPYSETSDRGAPSSFHDPLRRSGSTKEGPTPPTPTSASRSRFLRSKSVKEEKISKSSGGQFPHHYKHQRESKIKQEAAQQPTVPIATINQEPRSKVDSPSAEKGVNDLGQENSIPKTIKAIKTKPVTAATEVRDDVQQVEEVPVLQPPIIVEDSHKPNPHPEPEVEGERETEALEVSAPMEKDAKDVRAPVRSNSGGLLRYSRLFGARKNATGERKSDNQKEKTKEKAKPRTEISQKKSETSLVRSLLRRKVSPPSSTSTSPNTEKKKRGGFKLSLSAQPSPEASECETPGYLSEDCSVEMEIDTTSAVSALTEEACKERAVYSELDNINKSSMKCVDDVFPDKPPVDKGCLKLLEDETKRGLIEGFDFVADLNELDNMRGGILGKYAAHLMDDVEFEKMFSTGIVNAGSGRGGFSYSPLVEMEEQQGSSLETYLVEGGVEVEKCVSFLGRTSVVSSPEDESMIKREVAVDDELPSRPDVEPADELVAPVNDDLKAPSTPELSESRKTEDRDEIIERVAKKFSAKGRVVLPEEDGMEETVCTLVGREDCGQPSPVSVLECPFEDETASSQGNVQESICELDDEDLVEDEDAYMDDLLYESVAALQKPRKPRKPRKSTPVVTPVTEVEASHERTELTTDKIVGAILDISRIRCIDPLEIGLEIENSESFQEEEEDYVTKVLSLWEMFPSFSGNTGSDLPVNPTLFDRLESQERAFAWGREKDAEELGTRKEYPHRSFKQWQSRWLHRRLLFDSVNEAMSYRLKYKYPDPWIGKPVLRPPPKGRELVKEVYREIKEWREVTTEELDTIIEKDMSRGPGNWSNHNQEIAEIGLEIERTILRVMIEELVTEIMGISTAKVVKDSVVAY